MEGMNEMNELEKMLDPFVHLDILKIEILAVLLVLNTFLWIHNFTLLLKLHVNYYA